ncbi:MAG: hypothetical protein A2X61_07090 [Ignavibacteria bacterium GWB2_35_12]|nr:MAG: hypothetical protein A2X63_06230 [Ignavibacteria bacterium GWA2_35_8]OGU39242.1 MAG: hypothetical protein A2X61_07090 [Ignavibacteria bacterium GWB2_35_12]OGU88685.1 MAG: hypothetical protein A2220_00520 [Ignavibacteria bacterium RIFOXYA2_FULL_35_10]OGV23257.1 MAG: hypothetical protein A2475_13465 [Ignavibacteria bacterium RIFOXYC2_FULL_35_21]
MYKRMFLTLLIFTAFMLFYSCQKTDDKKEVTGKSTEAVEKEVIADETGTTMSDDGGLKTMMGNCYGNYSLSQYLSKGAEVIFDNKKDCYDISQLIGYAKDPYQVVIKAKGMDNWCVAGFVEKGARVLVDCQNFTNFEVSAFINHAAVDKESNVIVYACGCCCGNVLEYVKMGARIKINKIHEPFNIINYIDAGWKLHNKALVEVDAYGFDCHWVAEFIRRGANIFVGKGFYSFDVLQFAKITKETNKADIKIDGKFFTLKEIQRFLDYDATVIVGRHYKYLGWRFLKYGLNAFEVAELIRKNPSHVIVVGDFYQAHEIAEFIRLGAKVIFIYCSQDNCDIEAFLNKTPPPARDVLSQDNKAGKTKAMRFFDYKHTPKPCRNCGATHIID